MIDHVYPWSKEDVQVQSNATNSPSWDRPFKKIFKIHCPLKTQWGVPKSHQASCDKNSVLAYDYYGNLQSAQKDCFWAVFFSWSASLRLEPNVQ